MDITQFTESLEQDQPDAKWAVQLKALWWDAKGDWQQAHGLIDHLTDQPSARVHAYLHRVEGDLWNAKYWYNRSGEALFSGSLEQERDLLVKRF